MADSTNKKIFHGGCTPCYSQDIYGITRCKGCQCYESDWSKPNLLMQESEYKKIMLKHNENFQKSSTPRTFNELVSPISGFKLKKTVDRKKMLKQVYLDIENDFSEGTKANHIHEFFREMLAVIPKEFLEHNFPTIHFKDALKEKMGEEFKEEKPGKRYI